MLSPESQPNNHQQAVYASLLRFAPETIPLRERVVERLVLAALENSTANAPKRVGAIQRTIKFGPNSPDLRVELIQETLDRLIHQGKVKQTQIRKRIGYYLNEAGREEVATLFESSADLFAPVLAKLQLDSDPALHGEVAKQVYKKFISESFSRFGLQIARNMAREIDSEQLLQAIDLRDAFEVSSTGLDLQPHLLASLRARCFWFIRSTDAEETRLKFALAQGYYLAHLLGLQAGCFNPAAENAFSDSTFYLDSNVLFVGLLSSFDRVHLFEETLRIAKRVGIELRVTRATIDEVRRVAAGKKLEFQDTISKVPSAILVRTKDSILEAYLDRLESNPALTVEEFFGPFDHLSDTVSQTWGIVIDDCTAEELVRGRDFSGVENILQTQTLRFRKRSKGSQVLAHDIAHYALICDSRQSHPKTWFLTHDRSMIATAELVAKRDEQPFCFSMLGFLQAISPFVTSDAEQHSLADLFNLLLGDQFVCSDKIFDMQEIRLLSKMHQDVMSTPPEQLVLAFDYVKSRILEGKQYTIEDFPRVSLEIRKFLTCTDEQRRRLLETQLSEISNTASRLEKQLEVTSDAQQLAVIERQRFSSLASQYSEQNSALKQENTTLCATVEQLKAQNNSLGQRFETWSRRIGILGTAVASALGVLLLATEPFVTKFVGPGWKSLLVAKSLELLAISAIMSAGVWVLRRVSIHENIKLVITALLLVCVIRMSHIASPETLAGWQTYIDFGLFFATALAVYSNKDKLMAPALDTTKDR